MSHYCIWEIWLPVFQTLGSCLRDLVPCISDFGFMFESSGYPFFRLWVHVWEFPRREPGLGAGHEADRRDDRYHGGQDGGRAFPVVHGAVCPWIPRHQVTIATQLNIITLSPPSKLLSAKFLVCFNFQNDSMSLKVDENLFWVSNILDLGEMQRNLASHPDPSCLHMEL